MYLLYTLPETGDQPERLRWGYRPRSKAFRGPIAGRARSAGPDGVLLQGDRAFCRLILARRWRHDGMKLTKVSFRVDGKMAKASAFIGAPNSRNPARGAVEAGFIGSRQPHIFIQP